MIGLRKPPLRSDLDVFDREMLYLAAERRRTVLLWIAIIPLLLVLLSSVFIFVQIFTSANQATNWYALQAVLALSKKDYATARLCYSGLLQREPLNPKYQFGMAMSLAGLGQTSTAALYIQRLAPESETGYAPAHTFVAEQLMTAPSPDADSFRRSEEHLQRAVAADPMNQKAHALLSAIYIRSGRWEQVKEHLPKAGEAVDEIGLTLAQSYLHRGDQEEAANWARRASRFFRRKCLMSPADTTSRLAWAQANYMLQDYPQAMEIVWSGWKDHRQEQFRQPIAEVALAWCQNVPLAPLRRLQIVQQGLEAQPQNPGLLMQLAHPLLGDSLAGLKPSTRPSETSAVEMLARGVQASRSADAQEAAGYLRQAFANGTPEMLATAANLTCLWGYSNQPDASSAVKLGDALQRLYPQEPIAQRAYGLVLSRHGRVNLASEYLALAIKAMPHDRAIRTMLAQCYDQMGMPEEAAQQRRLLETPAPATPSSEK